MSEDYMREMTDNLLKQKERIIFAQLEDLIKRGLLVVESTQPVLTKEKDVLNDDYKIELKQAIRLTIREKEYIEKLEAENKDLKEKLSIINKAVEIVAEGKND